LWGKTGTRWERYWIRNGVRAAAILYAFVGGGALGRISQGRGVNNPEGRKSDFGEGKKKWPHYRITGKKVKKEGRGKYGRREMVQKK